MKVNFKKTAVSILTISMLSSASAGFIEANELRNVNSSDVQENVSEGLILYDRNPTYEELKNAKGDTTVYYSNSDVLPYTEERGISFYKAKSPITNRKKHTKTIDLAALAGGAGSSATIVGFIKQSLGKSVRLGPLAAISATAGGLRALGYKKLIIHYETMYTSIAPDTGAKLKKKRKITRVTSYQLKK
ncbi:hypothetical protein [Staphylococcus felis]|uniref:hypothetical protein n=1 Tax=Staphylococcus felis TaxID=46127 RepID=UPI000CD1162E|nr:hypothetical protein [Staphylococcus felis]AVP36690.1 hypothetical protein C7J90_06890 [Staphylococcus felis]PNZ30802.1 hypothetical protein CD143_11895 [Staphylococcus felis]QQB03350.1 hypothetical protein I6H71_11605 [Staphylococcus felis]